jgi:peptidoglycan hydrolase CwlO-like protein
LGLAVAAILIFIIWLATRIAELKIDWSFVVPAITFLSLIYPALQSILDWLNRRVELATRGIQESIAAQGEALSQQIKGLEAQIEQLEKEMDAILIQISSHQERPAHSWAAEEIKSLQKIIFKVEARIATLQDSLNRERIEDLTAISREVLEQIKGRNAE